MSQEVLIWKLPNSSSVLVTAGHITLSVVVSKPAFQEEEEIDLCESHSQDCASANRAEAEENQANATLGVFNGGDSSKEHSSHAGPQTLQAEATNHVWTLGNGALPPFSTGFLTRSAPKPDLLSRVGDVTTHQRTLYFVTRAAHVSLYSGQMGELSPPTTQRVPPVQGGCICVIGL